MMDDIDIRRLSPADASIYRSIRLESLSLSPEAFGSAFESEVVRPLASFAERLERDDVFCAFHREEPVGIAGFFVQDGPKNAHKGTLWGVYVRPNARRIGIGRGLTETVIDLARTRVELLHLSVTTTNVHALRLYQDLGFVEYGLERDARKVNGRYYDDVLMALDLRPQG